MIDTPARSRHWHRPVATKIDQIALAMAEGATSPSAIAATLGIAPSHVRSSWALIRKRMGPQAK